MKKGAGKSEIQENPQVIKMQKRLNESLENQIDKFSYGKYIEALTFEQLKKISIKKIM